MRLGKLQWNGQLRVECVDILCIVAVPRSLYIVVEKANKPPACPWTRPTPGLPPMSRAIPIMGSEYAGRGLAKDDLLIKNDKD